MDNEKILEDYSANEPKLHHKSKIIIISILIILGFFSISTLFFITFLFPIKISERDLEDFQKGDIVFINRIFGLTDKELKEGEVILYSYTNPANHDNRIKPLFGKVVEIKSCQDSCCYILRRGNDTCSGEFLKENDFKVVGKVVYSLKRNREKSEGDVAFETKLNFESQKFKISSEKETEVDDLFAYEKKDDVWLYKNREIKQLTNDKRGYSNFQWSPDFKKLAFEGPEDDFLGIKECCPPYDFFVYDFSKEKLLRVTHSDKYDFNFGWISDDEFVFLERDEITSDEKRLFFGRFNNEGEIELKESSIKNQRNIYLLSPKGSNFLCVETQKFSVCDLQGELIEEVEARNTIFGDDYSLNAVGWGKNENELVVQVGKKYHDKETCEESVEKTKRLFIYNWKEKRIVEPVTPLIESHSFLDLKFSSLSGNYFWVNSDLTDEGISNLVYEVYNVNNRLVINDLDSLFSLPKTDSVFSRQWNSNGTALFIIVWRFDEQLASACDGPSCDSYKKEIWEVSLDGDKKLIDEF